MSNRRRNLTATIASLLALCGATASPALAAVPNPTISAHCGNQYVSAEGPDIHWLADPWTVQFRFRVQRYTTTGWQSYFTSGWRQASGSDWYAPGGYSTGAPANTYMRVIVDQYYYYNGAYQGFRATLPHHDSEAYLLPTTEYCRTN